MQKRFIILIDFSDYSGNLLRYASSWAQKINAELLLVHQTIALTPVLADFESKEHISKLANDEALTQLIDLSREIITPDLKVSYSVSEIPLQITLKKLLQEPFNQLVFLGLKGTGLLKKLLIGSTALQIIENLQGTIAAVPKEIQSASPEKIYVAVSDKHPLNLLELNKVLDVIHQEHIKLIFFYLAAPLETTDGMEKMLKDLNDQYAGDYKTEYVIYEGNNPTMNIQQVIHDKSNEILIVQKGSRLLSDQLFRKFLINELVYEGRTPLIILP